MPVPDFSPGEVLTAAAMDSIGLWLVKTQTIGTAVSSVTVTDAFSADYDAFKILVTGGAGSTTANLNLQLGSTNTAYHGGRAFVSSLTGVLSGSGVNNAASFTGFGVMTTTGINVDLDIKNPFLAARTQVAGIYAVTASGDYGWLSGSQDSTTSFTAFTITANSGTMTGGTIRVYGYRN
jgi:hypothetical protein